MFKRFQVAGHRGYFERGKRRGDLARNLSRLPTPTAKIPVRLAAVEVHTGAEWHRKFGIQRERTDTFAMRLFTGAADAKRHTE